MIARFLPGVRAVTYFTAGSVHMKYWHFLFFDSVAALASAPVFIYLGYRFGGGLEILISRIRDGQRGVLAAIAVAGLVFWLYRRFRNRREAQLTQKALEENQHLEAGIDSPKVPSKLTLDRPE
jgi:membrane protein DedA with SNARE-associated domain